MASLGLVAIDNGNLWPGGRYYLQHLVRCAASLNSSDSLKIRDVYWGKVPGVDAFAEIREILGAPVVVDFPDQLGPRVLRRLRQFVTGASDASDLFRKRDVSVFFPVTPCENTGIPFVFWCPDFQHLKRPDLISKELASKMSSSIDKNVRAAKRIVLSSEDARRDFVDVYPAFSDRTHIVRFCSVPTDDWWILDPRIVAASYGLPERFFVVCNQFTRHKNHSILLRALHVLRQRGESNMHIACTGSFFDYKGEDYISEIRSEIQRMGLVSQVSLLGFIPRDHQIALMRRSLAVLQPSLFEGWSTIIEDAKSLGKAVLASAIAVHLEQLGPEQPAYLAAEDEVAWADALYEVNASGSPGPDFAAEAAAALRTKKAMTSCGQSFVDAVRAAI